MLFRSILSPQCPDSAAVGRCTVDGAASWALLGQMLVLVLAFFISIPGRIKRFAIGTGKVVRAIWTWAG